MTVTPAALDAVAEVLPTTPRRLYSNKYSADCTGKGCREFVEQGRGASLTVTLETALGPRTVWQVLCRACAEKAGYDPPVGEEHFTVRLFGAGWLELIPRRQLGNQKFEFFRLLSDQHGLKFDKGLRQHLVPKERAGEYLAALSEAGFELAASPEVQLFVLADAERRVRDAAAAEKRVDSFDVVLAKRGLTLYPFQKVGIEWLAPRDRGLLCDEMGLGKTVQILMALPQEHKAKQIKSPPVLIVSNANAKGVWEREAAIWRPEFKVIILEGKGSFRWPQNGEILITNYDILPDPADIERAALPDTVVVADEAHALKNKKAKRTGKFRAIGEKARDAGGRTWLATGTPILSRPEDLWSLAQCAGLASEAFGTWSNFKELFHCKDVMHPCPTCGHTVKHSKEGGCSKKACKCEVETVTAVEWGEPSAEVPERFAKIALRRKRVDVLPDLPGKMYEDHPVRLAAELKRAIDAELPEGWEAALEDALESAGGVAFNQMSSARRALAEAKTAAMLSLVQSFEEQDTPLIVMSCHSAPLELFRERPGWGVITGDVKSEDRTAIASAFQSGELHCGIAGNVKAAGTAITLVRASHMLFVDQEWNPGLNAQAEDRICRIGQVQGVMIHRIVADHALDRRVAELLDKKRDMIAGSLGSA